MLLDATTTLQRLYKSLDAIRFVGVSTEVPHSLPTLQTESKLVDHAADPYLAGYESLLPQRRDLFAAESEGFKVGGNFIDFSNLAIFFGFLPRHK